MRTSSRANRHEGAVFFLCFSKWLNSYMGGYNACVDVLSGRGIAPACAADTHTLSASAWRAGCEDPAPWPANFCESAEEVYVHV
jgi:hypothetical protein